MDAEALTIVVGEREGAVSALWLRPRGAKAALVFAHGAGAGMTHAWMKAAAAALAEVGIATLRYQFPYTERGERRPSPRAWLLATVRAAVAEGRRRARGLPLLAGGKSMGGRMSSQAMAEAPLEGVRGLVFFGFPLHPAGRPGTERADHLADVTVPMLFLQGTRDKLAEWELVEPVATKLEGATLVRIEGADHGFHVLKRSGRTGDEVLAELAQAVRAFADAC